MPRRTQVAVLGAIVVVTCLVQALAIWRTAVPALDAVRFVNAARAIDQSGLFGVLPDQADPPLFPISVWAVHRILSGAVGEFRESWALSVQLAAALPLVVIPIPLFLLGKRFVGPHTAMLGTVLVLCLPELVRLGADGISDSSYLLAISVAFALLTGHLQPLQPSNASFVPPLLAGLVTALAVLTRSEAAVVAAAFAILLGIGGIRRRQIPWRSALSYAVGLSAILGPYLLLLTIASQQVASETVRKRGLAPENCESSPLHTQPVGCLSPFSDGQSVCLAPDSKPDASCDADLQTLSGEPLSFAPKDPTISIRRRGLTAAGLQLLDELPRAFGYLPGILALVGFCRLRRRPVSDADRLLEAFCALLLAAIVFHTAREGYLSSRHLLPLALAATACIGTGAQAIAEGLYRALGNGRTRHAPLAATALVLLVATVYTFYAARPHRESRIGHRSAARWLAHHGHCGDHVVDTQGWTGLYSGLTTVPFGQSRSEWSRPELRYLVIEAHELVCDSRRSRTLLRLLQTAGTLVATFPSPHTSDRRPPPTVLVYQWNGNRP